MNGLIAREEARTALETWLREHGTLSAAAATHPATETLRGRGAVRVVPSPISPGERWAVRHYHRGGAAAALLGDRYLRLGAPRPLREYRVGRELERRGVPTVPHVGAAWYPAGAFRRGDLVTGFVPAAPDLAAVLFGAGSNADPAGAMRAAGSLLRRLHEAGLWHPDLNLKNILIRPDAGADGALVLDLDRARLRPRIGGRARRRMVDRFWRSARKWSERTGRSLDPAWIEAFRSGYEDR